jgi:hypothetical protein
MSKSIVSARSEADLLRLQIDLERRILGESDVFAQRLAKRLGQADQQQAVLAGIARKYVAEAGRDDASDAEIGQRPDRMLARRSAAEIAVGDEDLRLSARRLVKHEIAALAAVLVETEHLEQMFAEPGAGQRFHIIRGNDHVGIDIGERQRRRDRFHPNELLHTSLH